MSHDESGKYWYCVKHQRGRGGRGHLPADRPAGPYATQEEAARALRRRRSATRSGTTTPTGTRTSPSEAGLGTSSTPRPPHGRSSGWPAWQRRSSCTPPRAWSRPGGAWSCCSSSGWCSSWSRCPGGRRTRSGCPAGRRGRRVLVCGDHCRRCLARLDGLSASGGSGLRPPEVRASRCPRRVDGLGPVGGAGLADGCGEVVAHRALREVHAGGDHGDRGAVARSPQDLGLALGQRGVADGEAVHGQAPGRRPGAPGARGVRHRRAGRPACP